jgi:two-component system sensor kinase FixL
LDNSHSPPSRWAAWLNRLRGASAGQPAAAGERPASRAALLYAMEQTSLDAIITIDDKGIVLSYSPAAQRLFGYAPHEVVGRNVKMLMPPHFRAEHDGYIRRYRETGERRIIGIGRIVAGQKKDGTTFPMELSVGESQIEGKAIFVGFIRDLSEIQSEQRRVQELQRQLFHVSRLNEMGQLASSLAHEVNQPLTAIMNYVQVGRQLAGEDEKAKPLSAILEKVEAQTTRAADLVKRLRAFVDRREVERRPANLNIVIEEALGLAMVGPASRLTRLSLELAPDLPDVAIDRVQIQQVIVNFLRNAIDAMEHMPRREATVYSVRDGGKAVRVSVADTGPGIDPELAPKLFGAFVTTKQDGMGVGLSICRTIVEAHRGRIWFDRNGNGGATFHFTIPVGEEAALES